MLDAGCGDGELLALLAARGADVTGLDADPVMLAAAVRRLRADGMSGALVRGDLRALPFPDRSFDVVTAVAVLCLVPGPDAAIREMARILKPGGQLVLGELGCRSLWAAIRRLRGFLGSATWHKARFWTPSELRALIESVGLQAEVVRGGVFYPPAGWIAAILAGLDPWLGRRTTFGAAFLGVRAR